MPKTIAAVAVGALLVGLLGGYLWWGLPASKSARETADAKARLAEEDQQAAEARSKLADLEAEMKRFRESLQTERETRQRLEQVLTKGRK
jgi:hypothetical protein